MGDETDKAATEQVVASFFHLSRSLAKQARRNNGADGIVEALHRRGAEANKQRRFDEWCERHNRMVRWQMAWLYLSEEDRRDIQADDVAWDAQWD